LATPISNQEWRDFLFDGLLSASYAEKLVHWHEQVKALFASTIEELQLSLDPPMSDHIPHFPSVPVADAQKILWELTELNFCFELLALDKRAYLSHCNEDDQQAMVVKCFIGSSLLVADPEHANAGLQSHEWWIGYHLCLH
jgi:hypothetical protein